MASVAANDGAELCCVKKGVIGFAVPGVIDGSGSLAVGKDAVLCSPSTLRKVC